MKPILILFLFYLAKEDCRKKRLDPPAVFLCGVGALFYGRLHYGFPEVAYHVTANLLFWAVSFLFILLAERLTRRFLLGGADLLLWLALAPALKPPTFALLLPLACLLALPVQVGKLWRDRSLGPFPLVPYMAITVILFLLNGG